MLQIKNICKTYKTGDLVQQALDNVSLDLRDNEFVAILGPSGSGKSTLLYALSGMDRPSLGTITYHTEDPDKKMKSKDGDIEISTFSNDQLALFRRNHCGFVFQQNYLNDSMSALDNVMVSGLLRTKDRKALAEKAKELLMRVEIGAQDWKKFAGGQQQRVAVVRGVINSPEVLFADEPTGALNSQNTSNVLDILSDLNQEGQSIVMVTHTVKAAERANRVIYLADGVITDEVDLGPFLGDYKDEANPEKEKAVERHRRLKDFLSDMGW